MVAHVFFILFCSMFRQARSNQARSGCDYFANQTRPKQIWRKSSVNENKLSQGGHTLWKTGKTGKMINKNSLQGKIREFDNFKKIREKSGNFENPVLIRCNL